MGGGYDNDTSERAHLISRHWFMQRNKRIQHLQHGTTLTFAGPSTFNLAGGIYNGGGAKRSGLGSGTSTNSYNIGQGERRLLAERWDQRDNDTVATQPVPGICFRPPGRIASERRHLPNDPGRRRARYQWHHHRRRRHCPRGPGSTPSTATSRSGMAAAAMLATAQRAGTTDWPHCTERHLRDRWHEHVSPVDRYDVGLLLWRWL